jgi:DNA-binding HxlR family transcriptional regulator
LVIHPPDRPTVLEAGGDNSIAHAIGITADEWTLLIMKEAEFGRPLRYGALRERLPISDAMLAARLRMLTGYGMLRAVEYSSMPRRSEYRLTPRGAGIWPVLVGIWAWEVRWVPGQADKLPAMRHAACGRVFLPELHCAGCGGPASLSDVDGTFGPSWSWRRSVPKVPTRRRAAGSNTGDFAATLALIGNRWAVSLLGAIMLGAHRFGEFRQLTGAPAPVVSQRLRLFCEYGALHVAEDGGYHLTEQGRDFFGVIASCICWGARWFRSPEGPALTLHHHPVPDEEHDFTALLCCGACHAPLSGQDLEVVPAVAPVEASVEAEVRA